MTSNIDTLRANLGGLDDRTREFAQSLLDQHSSRGLTTKQLAWIDKLAVRATMPQAEIGDVAGVLHLMEKAGMRAKITIRADDALTIRLSVSGQQSSQPGTVAVTSTDKGFGYRKFYGRISREGTFVPGRDATAEALPAIVGILRAMAIDPAGTAAAYGKLTGSCCFCALELTDRISLLVGYGPVCAKRYGLPWGCKP